MALLFTPANAPLAAPFVVHTRPSDALLVGADVWSSLSRQSLPSTRLGVSITPPTRRRRSRLPSLVAWASLDESLPTLSVAIPQRWRNARESVFECGPEIVQLLVVELQPVTEVVLLATSQAAFQMANRNAEFLDHWFAESRILRAGDVIALPARPNGIAGHQTDEHLFEVDTISPILQGYLQKGLTQVVVLLSEQLDRESGLGLESDDNIEIDESFLAGSAAASAFSSLERSGSESISTHPSHHQESFVCESLPVPVSRQKDDETVYLKTADLGKLGLLNFDWGIVSTPSSNSRLVRVVVDDEMVSKSGIAKTSPTLLYNIYARDSTEPSPPRKAEVMLLPSPFGSHRPFIPAARTITVARVASPLSISRQYQHAFLGGLKSYFEEETRLVKQGDLIPVTIDTGSARWAQDRGVEESKVIEASIPINLSRANTHNGLVFFMITNVEYEVLADFSGLNSQDAFPGLRMGELGCFVDPDVTRIIQVGLEHSRIPDVGGYYETDQHSSRSIFDFMTQSGSISLSPSSPFGKLSSMVEASLSKFSLDCHLDLTFLVKGNRGVGKFSTVAWMAHKLGIHLMEADCYDLLGETDIKTEATLRVRFDQAITCSPCILVLRKLEAFAQSTQGNNGTGKEPPLTNPLKECIANLRTSWKMTGFPIILVGTTTDAAQVPAHLLSQFKHEISLEVPDEWSRRGILSTLLRTVSLASDVSIPDLATQTAALVAADLVDFVVRSKALALERVLKGRENQQLYVRLAGFDVTACDFENALGQARELYSESIGAPKIPTVSWDDVGGLARVKSDILDTIQLPLEHPELFAGGLKKRSGILLFGPPGTGKTLLAKAVATSCSLNFFSVKGPELLNMYIGESEANVRRVFQKARDAKPCVIFFDELDSIAPKRGNHGDSGGVMDRIVSQLLSELDGMASTQTGSDVFVIGATNRPDLLDGALLRPGRFDRLLYLGVSETHEAQLTILEALTRKFRLDPGLDLRKLAEKCPFNYTGADFYALCSDAMLNAMSRKAMLLEPKIVELNNGPQDCRHPHPITPQYYLSELATPDEILVTVNFEDFDLALHHLVPSVSQAEMEHYAQAQRRFTQG